MNCKEIQDLILTDYIDQELDLQEKKQVDQHLESCASCQALLSSVTKQACEPFDSTEKVCAPQSVWNEIKQAIDVQDQQPSFVDNLIVGAKDFFVVRRPVFALSTVFVVLLLVVSLVRMPASVNKDVSDVGNIYLAETFAYLSGTDSEEGDSDESDFGTDVEEYFL